METMRGLFTSLIAVSLMGVVVGCHHVAGKCDCENTDPCCPYGTGAHPFVPVPEIKALPKDQKTDVPAGGIKPKGEL
jgi:hypothetical protein